MTQSPRGPLRDIELRYWRGLADPTHGYGENVVEDAKHVLDLNISLMVALARCEELKQSLRNIADHKGKTNLSDCCVNRTCTEHFEDGEKLAHCTFQYGVLRGFNTCAHEAIQALAKYEDSLK